MVALENLKELDAMFSQRGINMFLLYGSALGAIRENDIISHDLDTDVGIMADQYDVKIIDILKMKGFKVLHQFGKTKCGKEIAVMKNGVKTDIWLIYKDEESGKYWNALWDNGGRNGLSDMIVHSYSKEILINNHRELLGEFAFNTPGPKYIEHVYGPHWKTPKEKWNWRTDHHCIDTELKYKLINKFGKNE
ncbi:MAG: hypothetical protein KAR08_12160 [Candidatus Heimdallarchaeota archaeon]|nr:hypothetical protein [Candidatus Heimdallarchaeota archaeon]